LETKATPECSARHFYTSLRQDDWTEIQGGLIHEPGHVHWEPGGPTVLRKD